MPNSVAVDRALREATEADDLGALRRAINAGDNIDLESVRVADTDTTGPSLLLQAVVHGSSTALIQFLIDAGADVNSQLATVNTTVITPLNTAVTKHLPGAIAALIAAGADVNCNNQADQAVGQHSKWSPVYLAIYHGYRGILLNLLRAGGLLTRDRLEQIHTDRANSDHAAKRGYLSGIRLLLDHGASLDISGGLTPLHIAAHEKRCHAAVLLLDAGANVNARATEACAFFTTLHYAVVSRWLPDDVNMCKLLLSRGALVDATVHGRTAETHARSMNREDTATLLADVRAAGGWAAYVAAPRKELLKLRRELPTQPHASPQAQLFLDPRIPDDVFMYVLQFWRCARDSEY
jgi:ankyrin repeat protein